MNSVVEGPPESQPRVNRSTDTGVRRWLIQLENTVLDLEVAAADIAADIRAAKGRESQILAALTNARAALTNERDRCAWVASLLPAETDTIQIQEGTSHE